MSLTFNGDADQEIQLKIQKSYGPRLIDAVVQVERINPAAVRCRFSTEPNTQIVISDLANVAEIARQIAFLPWA